MPYSKPGRFDLVYTRYAYGAGNNGQIATITDNTNATRSMTYAYDALARLQYATAGPTGSPTWKLGFVYDRYGNRTQQNVLAGSGFATQTPTDPVTNRLSSPNVYDASGNMTNDSLHSYTYDAENRIKTVDGTAATYTYDGGPLRVKKVQGATTAVSIYSGSKEIARYANGALNAEYVYAGDKLLAEVLPSGFRYYAHPDHLSNRVLTNPSGNSEWTGGNYPFGESWYQPTGNTDLRFTSYVRNFESGLDYAVFRDDSTRLGRFMSPDRLAGNIRNPQSLNRYAYVLNDPVNLIDPLGLRQVCRKEERDRWDWVSDPPDDPSPEGGHFELKTLVVEVCSEVPDPPVEPREPRPREKADPNKPSDPGDPAALEDCRRKAQQDYNKDWQVTGLQEGAKKIAEHALPEAGVHYFVGGGWAGVGVSVGFMAALVIEVAPDTKKSWEQFWELGTRLELCEAAFGPRP